jgi:hypothetical protein
MIVKHARRSIATAIIAIVLLVPVSLRVSAQASVDRENRYSNVGTVMVWRVDDAAKPVELRGFASGTGTDPVLVANVSDGGADCRRHNNNNRLDTRGVHNWIATATRQHAGDR